MKKFVTVAFWGMFISFLGSLPLGTMNITATHIAYEQGTRAAFVYASGSMIVEVAMVRIALIAMSWLRKQHKIFLLFEYFTVLLILFLSIASFVAAWNMSGFNNSLPVETVKPFWSGMILSATNPLHIPFWMGWTTVIMNKQILSPDQKQYNWYVSGIGTGTMLGFAVFIFAGNYFIDQITEYQQQINFLVGVILLITVIIQLIRMHSASSSVRYAKMMSDSENS